MEKLGIIGAGAFGTAMAVVAKRAGRKVTLWAHESDVAEGINSQHKNEAFLKGIDLDPDIRATSDIAQVCDNDAILIAVPSVHLRRVIGAAATHWKPGVSAMTCSKGVEQKTCKLMAEVVADCLGPDVPLAAMGGPTFAKEIVRDMPSAATIGCADIDIGARLSAALASKNFRTYVSTDITGVQLGGAVKNVLAIACGVIEGRGLGDNARAALITRGLAEMNALALVIGAESHTLMGLAGLGDLTLTCNAMQSRNFSLGYELGQGRKIDDILASRTTVAEGYYNAETVTELARRNQVDMPICIAVEAVINVDADLDAIIHGLLSRPLKVE